MLKVEILQLLSFQRWWQPILASLHLKVWTGVVIEIHTNWFQQGNQTILYVGV